MKFKENNVELCEVFIELFSWEGYLVKSTHSIALPKLLESFVKIFWFVSRLIKFFSNCMELVASFYACYFFLILQKITRSVVCTGPNIVSSPQITLHRTNFEVIPNVIGKWCKTTGWSTVINKIVAIWDEYCCNSFNIRTFKNRSQLRPWPTWRRYESSIALKSLKTQKCLGH
jgi:hypothetical protein